MTNSTSLTTTTSLSQDEDDMFSDLEPLSLFEIKKDYCAVQLAALMAHSGKSRSDMARELGWKRSRITKVLSGEENLTIKTICDFSSQLGFDFDIAFHKPTEQRPKQPWQISFDYLPYVMVNLPSEDELPRTVIELNLQTAKEVAIDFMEGKSKDYYVSVLTSEAFAPTHARTRALDAPRETNTVPLIGHEYFVVQD